MKKLLLISIALLLIAGIYADVIIGTGTSTGRYPLNDFYKHSRSQCIYTAEEIGVPAGGTITHLRWYRNDTGANPSAIGTTEIWLTETTATTLSTWQPEGTLVATITDIDLGNGGDWFEVDITDFPYTGSNLMVSVRTQNAPYTTPHSYWRYTSTTPNYRSLLGNSDSVNPPSVSTSYSRPNITLVGITQTIPPGVCDLVYPTPSGVTGISITPTLSWSASSGNPTGYDVYFGETLPAEGNPNADHTVQTATTWSPGTLSYSTTYSWKIVPWNSNGHPNYADCPTWTFTTMADPTKPLPYSQDFNSGTSLSAIEWTGNMLISSTHGNDGTNGLYRNLYSGVTTCNAVTPPIGPMTADCQILFEYRIVNYTGYPGTGTTLGAGDKIEVQISNDNGTNYTTIHTIDQNNHVTSNAFAAVTVPVTAYNADIIYVKFLGTRGAGDYYVDIDNVVVREAPQGGLLTVNPDPVECGTYYIGYQKPVQVSLTNTGVAAFDVTSITLADYTNFNLANLPTLPVTINPGDPAVTFDVVFAPTMAGALTTNLLINDTRQNSSIVVSGTGVQALVGEICENPYLATLPLVDYAGTTAGYANDYTSEMFTELGNTNYVRGQDWVAKITIPGNGLLDISLADQTGYNYQYMGVFLVNTIPSIANPAAVLAQAYGTSTPLNIADAVVSAGDYYVIVDNWPSPYDVYFVLNISFEPVTSAPNPATLVSPANGATDVPLTQTLNWSSGGGFVEGYRLSFGTVTPYTTIVNNVDLGMDTTYTPTLNYSTEYWWTVTPYNTDFGDASPITEWTFTTRDDPTIYAPWLEDFGSTGATFPPANWTRGNGLLADPSNITSGSYWVRDDWLNDTPVDPVNYAAKMNVYSTNRGGWLITPPIQMPGTGYQLELDIGLTDYGAHAAPDTPTDDRFIILIGDGSSWAPANILREWNNTGSDYVYDEIPYTGEHVIIPIDSYTGIQYIAFYGESIASGGDNDLFVDNVSIRLAGQAPDHVTLLAPADLSNTVDPGNCVLSWQDAVSGGYPEWYEIFVGSDLIDPTNDYYGEYSYESTSNSLDLVAQGNIDLGFNTTWYWAVLPYNTAGSPDPTGMTVFRFTTLPDPTIVALPHEEYFDDVTAPALPYGWSAYVNSSTTGALVATYNSSTYAQSAPNSVRLYNSTDASADLRLITPPIDASIPLNTIKLKFYARSSSAGYPLLIGTVNAPDSTGTFTQIASIDLTSTKTEYIYSLEDYVGTDQYICFKHGMGGTYRGLYVDNVQLIELLANDLAATAITGPSYLEAGETYEFTITVSNEGTADQNSYAVNLKEGTNTVATLNVSTPLASGASAQHTLSWTPTNGGAYTLSGQVVLTGDMNNTNDVTTSNRVYVIDNTVDLVYVGDDATTSSSNYLPVDMYYRNGVTEELYFTDEMHLQSGTITAIVYKNNFQNDRQDKAIKIWMAHTDVADLSGGWLPADNYTLVFDGLVDFPSGVNYVAIPLDTPFAYTGGTLATRVHRVFDSGSLSSSDKFFYTTNADHSTRSRYTRSDTEYGDQIPPTGTSYTLNYFPNTIFVTQNAVFDPQAVLSGHVYDSVTSAPIEGAMISLTERAVTYTDVNGYYEFVYWDSTFVDLTCSATDYYSSTVTGISFEPGTPVTQNFNLQPLPNLTVSGVVTANDYPAGLAGALVELFGYHDYSAITDANGAFSIADVKGRADTLSYSWVVSKEGYQSEIGAFDAITTDINLGTINLTEYLWTPYNLVASHEGNDARLNWDPAEQPDFLFFDFEQNDGGFTVENNPSPGWEWGTSSYSGAHSGTKVWGTVLEGNYANNATYDLISPLSYPILSGGYLTFWHRYNFEFYTTPTYYDGGIVQISTDDGATWETITPVGGYPCTSSSTLGYIPMYGGEQLEWTQASFDLSEYVGQTVRFKWRLLSESSVNREGWYVDDVLIGVPTAKTTLMRFASRDGDRSLQNYSVYRFPVAEEETPANWTLLSNNCATETYLDTGFAALSSGAYKWAVKANYSGSLESESIISNALGIFGIPQNVVATTTTDGNVNLAWTAEPGASYYVIYGSHDPYGTYTILGYSATNSYDYVVGTDPFHFFKIAAADGVMPTPAPAAKTK